MSTKQVLFFIPREPCFYLGSGGLSIGEVNMQT